MTERDHRRDRVSRQKAPAPVPDCALGEPPLNAGQSLVAAFRAARLRQRPGLQTELRTDRAALRQERLNRRGRAAPPAEPAAPEAEQPAFGAPPAREEQSLPPNAGDSIFARFIDGAQQVAPQAPPPEAATLPPAETQEAAQAEMPPAPAPALASIGFGPGMVMRFRQLGIETAADLAAADSASLRSALGDITRLINVDIWIASAQKACAEAA